MKIKDIVENKNKQELPQSKPRNFVAKNAMSTTSGAGAHRDKKREQKQGYEKHKGKEFSEDALDEGTRLIGRHEAGNKSVAVYRDTDWGEFIVRFYVDDEWDEDSDYHTDDKQDAFDTAKHWLSKAMPTQHGIDETGEPTGTIAAVSSDGKQVTVKNKDGSTTQTTAAAFVPGPNNTVTMKPDAAGDTLKPGATQIYEHGTPTRQGRHIFTQIMDDLKEGMELVEIMEEYPEQYIKYHGGIERAFRHFELARAPPIWPFPLMPWMQEIEAKIACEHADGRHISWYVNPEGGAGKSWFVS